MRRNLPLACLMAALVAASLVSGCGGSGDEGGSGSPESVAKEFWEASLTGDAETSWGLLSDVVREGIKTQKAWSDSGVSDTLGDGEVVAGTAKVDGDSATVKIKIMKDGEEVTSSDTMLVKEGGEWKVKMP